MNTDLFTHFTTPASYSGRAISASIDNFVQKKIIRRSFVIACVHDLAAFPPIPILHLPPFPPDRTPPPRRTLHGHKPLHRLRRYPRPTPPLSVRPFLGPNGIPALATHPHAARCGRGADRPTDRPAHPTAHTASAASCSAAG